MTLFIPKVGYKALAKYTSPGGYTADTKFCERAISPRITTTMKDAKPEGFMKIGQSWYWYEKHSTDGYVALFSERGCVNPTWGYGTTKFRVGYVSFDPEFNELGEVAP